MIKNPDESLFITINQNIFYSFFGNKKRKNVLSSEIVTNRMHNYLGGNRIKTIILDEYLFFNNKRKLYQTFRPDH